MTQIATTIEQSQRLIELGVAHETADMYYKPYGSDTDKRYELIAKKPMLLSDIRMSLKNTLNSNPEKVFDALWDGYISAWSLEALLGLLENPKLQCDSGVWTCAAYWGSSQRLIIGRGSTPFEAACSAISRTIKIKNNDTRRTN
jgi:hypothetical protein